MKEEIKPIEVFYPNGRIQSRRYLNAGGKPHRDPKEGPSHQGWYCNEQPAYEQYWVNGKLHRDPKEGPAYQSWNSDGLVNFQQYYVTGTSTPVTKEENKK